MMRPGAARAAKNLAKRSLLALHRLGARFGVHVLPVHYYSAIPDVAALERTRAVWAKRSELPGLDVDVDEQVAALEAICRPYRAEYEGNRAFRHATTHAFGPGYGYVEAQALHAVIRHFKPSKVVEVGSGVSTWCMLEALRMNETETDPGFSLTCIEPYPSRPLRALEGIALIERTVQTVAFDEAFSSLGENDLLFIDSSHTVKPGSDVNYLILEILPRLAPGVIVHFHDVYLPYDYARNVLETFLHWMETSLLRAFLVHNERARMLFSLSILHYDRRDALREIFPEYVPQADVDGIREGYAPFENPDGEHFPSSIYVRIGERAR